MAVELTANAVQAVPAGQNVLFTDTPVKCGRGYVVHRDGAGLVTLRGICNGCCSWETSPYPLAALPRLSA